VACREYRQARSVVIAPAGAIAVGLLTRALMRPSLSMLHWRSSWRPGFHAMPSRRSYPKRDNAGRFHQLSVSGSRSLTCGENSYRWRRHRKPDHGWWADVSVAEPQTQDRRCVTRDPQRDPSGSRRTLAARRTPARYGSFLGLNVRQQSQRPIERSVSLE
jgi:hypothetical protein